VDHTLTRHGRPTVPDTPQDPITDLAAGAAQCHELFVSYVEAGFTEAQALQIVIGILTAGLGGGQ
jgi:hypothetical protein